VCLPIACSSEGEGGSVSLRWGTVVMWVFGFDDVEKR
jgi:hypothetical protein